MQTPYLEKKECGKFRATWKYADTECAGFLYSTDWTSPLRDEHSDCSLEY